MWCGVQTVRIGADEEVDDMQGLKPEEINKRIQEKEAKAHAQILEMVRNIMNVVFVIGCVLFKSRSISICQTRSIQSGEKEHADLSGRSGHGYLVFSSAQSAADHAFFYK